MLGTKSNANQVRLMLQGERVFGTEHGTDSSCRTRRSEFRYDSGERGNRNRDRTRSWDALPRQEHSASKRKRAPSSCYEAPKATETGASAQQCA